MFSNDGPWVRYLRPGAAPGQHLPHDATTPRRRPATEVPTAGGEVRRSLDPDNYSAGFAIWSGTSFAAPVFAGQLAAGLQDEFERGDDGTDPTAAVARGRRVLAGMPRRERS